MSLFWILLSAILDFELLVISVDAGVGFFETPDPENGWWLALVCLEADTSGWLAALNSEPIYGFVCCVHVDSIEMFGLSSDGPAV